MRYLKYHIEYLFESSKKLIKGTVSYMSLNRESRGLYRIRSLYCGACNSKKTITCGECGCLLFAKKSLKEEKCPLGKW